ncbi:glutamate dehydrogenase [Actinacidiphila glaucinigra]|uniref:Glutamate dehydrogenase n=1 Tax=Actinacidiphila glaucinigra TaxID=235986 RepID=A0A239MSR2_9ACTN|nr:glutamate dehydrogenase [Actinacidiphila glaucinigra]
MSRTVVEVVTDDMLFPVDSVTNELSRQDRAIHVVVHPQMLVRRDVTGKQLEVLDAARSATCRTTCWSSPGSTWRTTERT